MSRAAAAPGASIPASRGVRFGTRDEASSYVQGLLDQGRRIIDVGCFQVDLYYHPEAFARWQDGLDPQINAAAASRILQDLHTRTGDWNQAVALYHSADPLRGTPLHAGGAALLDRDRGRRLAAAGLVGPVHHPGLRAGLRHHGMDAHRLPVRQPDPDRAGVSRTTQDHHAVTGDPTTSGTGAGA